MAHGKYEKKKEKTGKKGNLWLKVFIVVLSVVLVIMIAGLLVVNHLLGRLGRFEDLEPSESGQVPMTDEFDTDSTLPGQETIQTVDASDVTFHEVEEFQGENIVNVMLIGQDARPGEDRARFDSMILVSLNREKNTIQLTSFMRDTYVQIPGYMDNRLNVAYRYGGTELMNETFKKNFGLDIDGNVMVDFDEFSGIIDMLGGVDIDLTQEELNYMYDNGCWDLSLGVNHLNGEEALTFARMRYVSGGDYGRTERQRRILISLAQSFSNASFSTIWDTVNELLPHVVTNLSDAQILEYVTTGASLLTGGAEIQSLRIPADDAHYGAMINGMSVLVPDLNMCREDLADFIYSGENG